MTHRIFVPMVAAALAACASPEPELRPTRLSVVDSVEHVEVLAREPMVVAHPSGALFVAGYGGVTPRLFTSTDTGKSWRRVNVGTERDGAKGNSDVDLAVGPDGTLYFLNMSFDRQRLIGTRIDVAVSRDAGATWTWTQLSNTTFDDRPWIEATPNGTVHAIWNDGAGVSHVVSSDTGRTWTERERIHPLGGSSHLAIGPDATLAVQVVPLSASGNRFDSNVALVAVSSDGGSSWQKHAPPGQRAWFPMRDTTVNPPQWREADQPRWVEPLAWDAQGMLYSFWAEERALWLARSADKGATWTSWKLLTTNDAPYFPYLVAGRGGALAASWFSGMGDSLRAHVAHLTVGADSTAPRVVEAPAFAMESFISPDPKAAPVRNTGGEYLPLIFLTDGSLGVVTPLQNAGQKREGFTWRRYRLQ